MHCAVPATQYTSSFSSFSSTLLEFLKVVYKKTAMNKWSLRQNALVMLDGLNINIPDYTNNSFFTARRTVCKRGICCIAIRLSFALSLSHSYKLCQNGWNIIKRFQHLVARPRHSSFLKRNVMEKFCQSGLNTLSFQSLFSFLFCTDLWIALV